MPQGTKLPGRTRTYIGGLTDTDRWDAFIPRDDDIFVCAMGKNGTTWMQTICTFLVFGSADLDFVPADRSTWFDATFQPIEDMVAHFEVQKNRRIIKTHTPFDGIPYFPQCTYITVWRDLRDAFLSQRAHEDNMKLDLGEPEQSSTADEDFRAYIDVDYEPGVSGAGGLALRANFIHSYFDYRHLPNLHFFHYADMKRDLRGEMAKVAEALGIKISDAKLTELAQAASFTSMKAQALKYVPSAKGDFWHQPEKFLHKGTSGQWQGVFSLENLRRFEERLDALVGPELAQWLINGSK